MLIRLHEYLLLIRGRVLPKSESGQAIAYTLKNWMALTRYCGRRPNHLWPQDGDLSKYPTSQYVFEN
jgi:hypothetical protein